MSAVRDYLTEKAAAHPNEWLRREPRATHPEILRLVRTALRTGLFYNDDVERFVNERVGDLAAHARHGADGRDPLIVQLGHEVYIAKGVIRDDEATLEIQEALAHGFADPIDVRMVDGARVELRCGTVYVGQAVAQFGPPLAVRLARVGDRWGFIPKGARTAYRMPDHALIRPGWPSKGVAPDTSSSAVAH